MLGNTKKERIYIYHGARMRSDFLATTVKVYNYQNQEKITGQEKKNPN